MKARDYVWRFDAPPDAVWRALSDTVRYNQAMGVPVHAAEAQARDDGGVDHVAHLRFGPWRIDWTEEPFEWVAGRGFRQCRRFRNGPFRSLCASLGIEADGAGTRARFRVAVLPRNLLGRAILAGGFFTKYGRDAARLMTSLNARLAADPEGATIPVPPARLSGSARAKIDAAVAELEAGPFGHGLAHRLAEHIRAASDMDAARIRPLALAREWGAPERAVIELCLAAAHRGLLVLQWDLLCPRCRGAKARPPALDGLPRAAHCPSCNIDFGSDFSRNVEVTFRPADGVRDALEGEYCLMGPVNTPHVLAQMSLAPGETREVAADLPAGAYRCRSLDPGPTRELDHPGGGFPTLTFADDAVSPGGPAPAGRLRLTNATARPRTLLIESRDWVAEALTAKRATALQAFRTLFPEEALAAAEDADIDSMAFLFTDLRGSTALYERIGDSAAYRVVRRHFQFLEDEVRARNGCVVKTIGDAVMAAFAAPADAVAAALAVQADVAGFNREVAPNAVRIRVGLHAGPCIAVTLNGRLDYFGATVNLAARLEGLAEGGDVVLSAATAADPAVAALLADHPHETEQARVKGIAEPVDVVRIGGAAGA